MTHHAPPHLTSPPAPNAAPGSSSADHAARALERQRLAMLGLLSGAIAHETNNLLTPILGFSQLAMQCRAQPERLERLLAKTVDAAERAREACQAVVAFAKGRGDAGHADLAAVGRALEGLMSEEADRRRIRLHVDLPSEAVSIPPVHLQQVLLNLVLNAMQAIGQGPAAISVTRGRESVMGRCAIRVHDTGPELDRATRARLTASRHSAAASHEHDSSSGLGLWLCQELLGAAGGWLEVEPGSEMESSREQGTTFCLHLPRTASAAARRSA